MIDIVYWGDDWIALYHNKKLLLEGHSLHPGDITYALGLETKIHDFNSDDELEMWDGPPDYFKDIKF